MSDTRVPRILFFAILAAGIARCIHDFPLLPDHLASHFAASGAANGWMTKQQFLLLYALVILPAAAVAFWAPRKIAKTPSKKLRLPNREYWLAPERRAQTFAYFDGLFAWFGCAFLLLEEFAMGLAMRANFETPPRLPVVPIVSALVAFVLFNVAGVVAMFRRFSTPH